MMIRRQTQKGFSLIEMAIVVMVSGLMLVGVMGIYSVYNKDSKTRGTYEKMEKLKDSMAAFYAAQGRYPCPAKPALDADDAGAGEESCTAPASPGTCDASGLCTAGGRTVDGAVVPVYVGGIPYKTLRLGPEDASPDDGVLFDDTPDVDAGVSSVGRADTSDNWGWRMSYAVSGPLTDKATFTPKKAAINVKTENNVLLVEPAGSAAWVAVAYNNNGAGAYNEYGVITRACTGAPMMEQSNCSVLATPPTADVTFISGLRVFQQGANYFDDMVAFATLSDALWSASRGDPAVGADPAADIVNRNTGAVGINTATPGQKLDVNGAMKAQRLRAAQVCNADGSKCFTPDRFGGTTTALKCASGVLQKLDGTCAAATLPGSVAAAPICTTSGQALVGFTSAGAPVCAVP